MTLRDELFEASYQGVTFPCLKTKTTGGRKTVKHEFPNTDTQSIEDLGLKPRSFKITAIITSDNYINRRNRLLQVLENGDLGVLIHPFFGRIESIRAITYSMNEDMTRLGDTDIEILFEVSNNTGLPVKSVNSLSLVSQQSTVVQDNVTSDITNKFEVTPSFRGNFEAAQTKLLDVVNAVRDNTRSFTASAAQINNFAQLVNDFEDNIPVLIQNPDRLASSLTGIFTTLPGLYDNAEDKFAALGKFADFGTTDAIIPLDTTARIQRDLNNQILNNSVRTLALSERYVAAAQIEFDTVPEIDLAADNLEIAFQTIKQDSPI